MTANTRRPPTKARRQYAQPSSQKAKPETAKNATPNGRRKPQTRHEFPNRRTQRQQQRPAPTPPATRHVPPYPPKLIPPPPPFDDGVVRQNKRRQHAHVDKVKPDMQPLGPNLQPKWVKAVPKLVQRLRHPPPLHNDVLPNHKQQRRLPPRHTRLSPLHRLLPYQIKVVNLRQTFRRRHKPAKRAVQPVTRPLPPPRKHRVRRARRHPLQKRRRRKVRQLLPRVHRAQPPLPPARPKWVNVYHGQPGLHPVTAGSVVCRLLPQPVRVAVPNPLQLRPLPFRLLPNLPLLLPPHRHKQPRLLLLVPVRPPVIVVKPKLADPLHPVVPRLLMRAVTRPLRNKVCRNPPPHQPNRLLMPPVVIGYRLQVNVPKVMLRRLLMVIAVRLPHRLSPPKPPLDRRLRKLPQKVKPA